MYRIAKLTDNEGVRTSHSLLNIGTFAIIKL